MSFADPTANKYHKAFRQVLLEKEECRKQADQRLKTIQSLLLEIAQLRRELDTALYQLEQKRVILINKKAVDKLKASQ